MTNDHRKRFQPALAKRRSFLKVFVRNYWVEENAPCSIVTFSQHDPKINTEWRSNVVDSQSWGSWGRGRETTIFLGLSRAVTEIKIRVGRYEGNGKLDE